MSKTPLSSFPENLVACLNMTAKQTWEYLSREGQIHELELAREKLDKGPSPFQKIWKAVKDKVIDGVSTEQAVQYHYMRLLFGRSLSIDELLGYFCAEHGMTLREAGSLIPAQGIEILKAECEKKGLVMPSPKKRGHSKNVAPEQNVDPQEATLTNKWSVDTFKAKVNELVRRLRVWDLDGCGPVQIASLGTSRHFVRLSFRQLIARDTRTVRPDGGIQLFPYHEGMVDEDGNSGEAYANPEELTDRSLTQFLMAEFLRQLNDAKTFPGLDYLKESFEQILRLPAWTLRRGKGAVEKSIMRGDNKFIVTGRPIPVEMLDAMAVENWSIVGSRTAPPEGTCDPTAMPGPNGWSKADSPTRWASRFGFSLRTLKRRIDDGAIRCKILSSKSYQIAVDDIPEPHRTKFLPSRS